MASLVFLGLAVAFIVQGKVPSDKVTTWPGTDYDGSWGLYSGFLKLNYTGGKVTHYILAESQNNATTDPLVIWFTGGPGCSSLEAFSYENGPYYFPANSTEWVKNPYSWNNNTTMLWFESPPGVGFSSYGMANNSYTNDTQTAMDNFASLLTFFEAWPEYKTNDFYIAGESYGGIYVPDLAAEVVKYNNASTTAEIAKINLKGFLIGNGYTDPQFENEQTYAEFAWWHALYGQTQRDNYEKYCTSGFFYNSTLCNDAINDIQSYENNVNPYDIYRHCWHEPDTETNFVAFHPRFGKIRSPREKLNDEIVIPCVDVKGSTAYWNTKEARQAFNVDSVTAEWSTCYGPPYLNYTRTPGESISNYPALIAANLTILLYSGDTDSTVPTLGTQLWLQNLVNTLNLTETEAWREWHYGGQVAGYTQAWNKNLNLATIKGTGHMSIQWKRPEGYRLFMCLLNGTAF